MNTQHFLKTLNTMFTNELHYLIAKLEAEELSLSGSARKLAEYKLHLAREELNRR